MLQFGIMLSTFFKKKDAANPLKAAMFSLSPPLQNPHHITTRRGHPQEALYLPTFSHLFDCQ
jgi:hypothetical protein